TNGRSGKGSDLFQVIQKGTQASCDASVLSVNPSLRILPATRTPLACQNGVLDCAFGVNGISSYPLLDYALVKDSKIDQNGRLVVLVESHPSGGADGFYVVRFSPDGSVDPTFGSGGVARVAFTSGLGNEFPQSLAVRGDGAIVVAGSVPSKANSGSPRLAAVARFSNTGALDPTFGVGGELTFSVGLGGANSWGFGGALPSGRRGRVWGTGIAGLAA